MIWNPETEAYEDDLEQAGMAAGSTYGVAAVPNPEESPRGVTHAIATDIKSRKRKTKGASTHHLKDAAPPAN